MAENAKNPGADRIGAFPAVMMTTTRPASRRHSTELRGLMGVPSSPLFEGRFGRMFRGLPVFAHAESHLMDLGNAMISEAEAEVTPEGEVDPEETTKPIPAGFTYLGQFIDHDLTFDPVSMLDRQNDPDALTNFRTPRFDLDSIYGRGPSDQPYLYDQLRPAGSTQEAGLFLLTGNPVSQNPLVRGPDLPRNLQGRALIGDPRNDENLIVSQLQSVMLRFHNRMLEKVAAETTLTGSDLMKETQRRVRWHYQWVVIHDFLPRIVGQEMVDEVFEPKTITVHDPGGKKRKVKVREPELDFYHPKNNAFMPVEFSVAAYRFGHSMIRPIYRFNSVQARRPIFSDDFSPGNTANLNGFRPLPQDWGFEWQFFFELGGNPATMPMQKAYRIDQQLVNPLGHLPPAIAANPGVLAQRNLLRGLRLGLPSGQTVARAIQVHPIPDEDLRVGPRDEEQRPLTEFGSDFRHNAPLWYYVLREAEVFHEGNQLGPVGGRIVAEVFVGILSADKLSYQSVDPAWTPELANTQGMFTMADLIRFAISG
jgi:Animal haem peroxidase